MSCLVCGKPTKRRDNKYCSPDCYQQARATAAEGITEEVLQSVADLAAGAFSETQIAGEQAWTRKQFRELRQKFPTLEEAFRRGRGKLETELVASLLKKARKSNSPTPEIFLLKSVFSYIDNPRPDAPTIQLANIQWPTALPEADFKQLVGEVLNPKYTVDAEVVEDEPSS